MNAQKYVGYGTIEWEPENSNINCGYGLSLEQLKKTLMKKLKNEKGGELIAKAKELIEIIEKQIIGVKICFYQGYQKDLPAGQPNWRIIITADNLLQTTNKLPSDYYNCPINWVSNPNPKKTCKKDDPNTKREIYGYSRDAPYLRIADEIAEVLNFPFKGLITVKIYVATTQNNDVLIILEPA